MLGLEWLDPGHILDSAGAAALWITLAIIFAECGVLLGFFLPGDTLLFTVGVFIANDVVDHSIWFACVVLSAGAILGNVCGYEIGRAIGPKALESERVRILRVEHVERTQRFFERYGAPAIILARFVAIVRTVITVIAGVAHMDRRRYLTLSTIGGVLWVFSITLLGYFLGGVPFVQDYIEPHLDLVLLGVVVLSILPVGVHLFLDVRRAKHSAHHRHHGEQDEEQDADHSVDSPADSRSDSRPDSHAETA